MSRLTNEMDDRGIGHKCARYIIACSPGARAQWHRFICTKPSLTRRLLKVSWLTPMWNGFLIGLLFAHDIKHGHNRPSFIRNFVFFWVNVSSSEASPRRLLSKGVRYLAFNDSINTHISPFLRLSPFNVAFTRLINSFKYCVGEKGPLSLLLNGYLLVSRVWERKRGKRSLREEEADLIFIAIFGTNSEHLPFTRRLATSWRCRLERAGLRWPESLWRARAPGYRVLQIPPRARGSGFRPGLSAFCFAAARL